MKKFTLTLYIFLIFLSCYAVAECDFDDFPVHPEMKLVPILGSGAVHNNQPVTIKGFYSPNLDVALLTRFYTRKWDDRIVESSLSPWNQLSTLVDNCMSTVQFVAADNGTEGRLVMTDYSVNIADMKLGVGAVIPNDAVVVTDTVMDDGAKKGRVTLAASGQTPAALARFYRSSMIRKGWALEQSFVEDSARVLVFRDGPALSNVLLVPIPTGTQILINSEEPD
ncbi:MAG: hypothetical protein HOI91_00205 [Halieaceae bacterium]|jgi:hypothetical protein|nr:hypothetical protein [Halieaceae bacterium]